MPFITSWFPEKIFESVPKLHEHAISMRPEYYLAIMDTINFYGWKKIIYIYDSDSGLLRLQQIYQSISPIESNFKIDLVRKIRSAEETISFLEHTEMKDRWSTKYIVLDCAAKTAKEIIVLHARSILLGKRTYHYLFSGLVMDDWWDSKVFEYGTINITGFRLIDTSRPLVKEFLKDWATFDITTKYETRQSISAEAALMHDAVNVLVEGYNRIFRKKTADILRNVKSMMNSQTVTFFNGSRIECTTNNGWITPWEHGEKISRILRKVEIEGLTGNIQFGENGRRENYTLHIVEMTPDSVMTNIADWNEKSGLNIKNKNYINLASTERKNRTYIVTTILEEPYLMLRKQKNGEILTGNDRYEGICKDLADIISETLKINYEFILVKDGNYGTKKINSKNEWDGMIGEILRNEADMAIAPITITAERKAVVDFTRPFMISGISVLMKKMNKHIPNVFSFMQSLSVEVWLCTVFSLVAVTIVLFVVSRFSSSEWHLITPQDQQYFRIYQNKYLDGSSPKQSIHDISTSMNSSILINDFSILNCFWFTISTFLQRGCDLIPRSLSGRIVSSVWWIFTCFLLSSYVANLVAFYLTERLIPALNSIEDVLKQSDIEYGVAKDDSVWNFLKESYSPTHDRVWTLVNSRKNHIIFSYEEGIQRVRNSKKKFVFLMDSIKADYVYLKQPCDITKIGQSISYNKGYGIAIPTGFPLKESLNQAITTFIENGKISEIQNRWVYEQNECTFLNLQSQENYSSLSLTHVAGAFYILIGGLIFAMITALIEFFYKSHANKSKHKVKL